ncbi:hypothetical protein PILCRDRAFT_813043 [Piloderma croceum F 1598]|uniref:Methyltransferase n=1 Tax=Piloderma croceum (strain F 1598) TaxID=765440 RepID=A0A0C3FY78_PILCF|nr:hypothetical protein PILCRDRAFT_813043 [Piloderma croceum F 1598]
MATPAVLAPRNVHTTLNYFTVDGNEAPYNYVESPPEGTPRTNIKEDVRPAVIHDTRGQEDTVGLDKTGFKFVRHVSSEKEFLDEEAIKTRYYQEVEALLKKETGAKRVFIFDHTIRRNYDANTPMSRGPVKRVHVDQTYTASVARVHYHLGDDADRLLKSRVRIINVWRPIGNIVAHNPLAVADFYSLDRENDLVSTRHIYPTREGATFSVRYNPKHQWYFLADQTPEEVTLIKCFDSDEDKARLTPHTAFVDPTSPESAPDRQSIEVRALVFDSE